MAFLAPFAEIVLEGIEAGVATNIVSGISNEFVKKAKPLVSQEAGKVIADYASNNPNGMVDMTLQNTIKNYNHRKHHPIKKGRIKKRIK